MAQSSERKSELIAELARSREALDASVHQVRSDLEVGRRVRESVQDQKMLWLTGAAVSGWMLARLPAGRRRRKKEKPLPVERAQVVSAQSEATKGGLLLAVLSFAFTILKPVITRYATGFVADWMDRRRDLLD